MRPYRWLQILVIALPALAALICPAQPAIAQGPAQTDPWLQDQDLAEAYAPVLYFHPDELFRPQPVEVMLRTAQLHKIRPIGPHVRLLRTVTASDLLRYAGDGYYLNAWLRDKPSSDYMSYTAHRAYYQSRLSPEAGGPPMVAYAHVVRGREAEQITIQYWLFYWYNDAFNKHEGDWELVQVMLTPAGEPEWLVLSQHHGGTRRPWSASQIEEGTHPAVYVALGSHANYFWGDEVYIQGVTVGNARVEMADRTGTAGRAVPQIVLMPDREQVQADPARWPGFEWLLFRGGWGEWAPQRDFSGPVGPADKGEQWEWPYRWGMAQPPDADTWYANRLRVEILGPAGDGAQVRLRAGGGHPLTADETLGAIALLHADPTAGTAILADIAARPGRRYDIVATWPDAASSRVIQYQFDDVSLGDTGRATLALQADGPPLLMVAAPPPRDRLTTTRSGSVSRRPTATGAAEATWDTPDVVWALGRLSAVDVLRGVVLSLLAAWLPPLVYVAVIYWLDQYEKEPVGLLAAAFWWGAVPALLIAVAVRIFFRLPPSLLGPGAIQLVSSGLVAPLTEELLIAVVILFIAWRHRREFDGVLDGMIYGAVVGLGFAMTANLVSYLGAFVQYGFTALGRTVYVNGFLYGLNQALYAAILGAGLGYARMAVPRWQRWAVPVAAFLLAVAIRAFHNLAIDRTTGWNLWTLAVLWAGSLVILVVTVWSLYQERRCLAAELAGEVPDPLYRWLTIPGGCWLAEWRVLRRGGVRALLDVRRAFQACSRLAFQKAHSRRPDEPGAAAELPRLRAEMARAVDRALPRLAT